MKSFLDNNVSNIFMVTIIITVVLATLYKDFDKIISPKEGIVISKYTITKTNYYGEEYTDYVLSLYDKFLDDIMSQEFNLIEYYVTEREYKSINKVPIAYTVSKSAKFKSRN